MHRFLLYTTRRSSIRPARIMTNLRRHPLCSLADRLPPHRRRAHRAVQLALCQEARRQDAAADRGHRPRAIDGARDRGDPGRAEMAGARLGRRRHLPVQPRRPPPRGRRAAARRAARPITATPRQRNSRRCARRRAPRAAPGSTTACGATATRPTAPAGMKPTIRLKAPQTGETVIEDQVQGRVVWQNENLDDLVLLRGDGNPTYMLAVVVDDHDMGVTHVIRGDDHLINAARQKQIYDALGWDHPQHVAHPADPWGRRRKAVEAPWRARRRSLPRPGLPAGGAAQLSGAARLEPWRPGNLLDAGDDRRVRSLRHRPFGGAVRFRQAGKPQRPLHPPGRRSSPREHVRGRAGLRPGRRRR